MFDDIHLGRRQMMPKIKSKNTSIEIKCRKGLFARGFRYRKNVRTLPGTPDIVLKKYNTVIFVNGCFWHHHSGCGKARTPKTHVDFWEEKINRNIKNDLIHQEQLGELGWNVIVVWECELSKKSFHQTMDKVNIQLEENLAKLNAIRE